ncbi:hypothetical protein L6452_16744 [Arctium lappa]|uniref:Uncharacterized protein n=1 Tax=Arctium lappa TaxID=4217 RepID=A0ACB9C1F3_ARCLA|nr:hypothetical protein L6452_16744 [Arctium lappa]
MHWAHSVSYDLINWIPLDLTLSPTESFDKISCWSGSATILPGNKPVMLYTGIDFENRQVQNMAIPKDLYDPCLKEWVKPNHSLARRRREMENNRGKSERQDRDRVSVGLFDYAKDFYMIGNYSPEKENYVPQNELTLSTLRYDYGKYYASKSFFDPVKNRRILMAWVNESDSEADDIAKGWSGLQSFPRSFWLDQNQKQLVQWPIEEIEMLHENKVSFLDKKLEGGSLHEVVGITASQIDHSVIESFGGEGRTCITARVYPTLAIRKEARLFAFNNGTESVVFSDLSAWSGKKSLINIKETISCTYQ